MSSEFAGKALEYHSYRPEYPHNLTQMILNQMGLKFSGLDVVELGCGTGKFTKIIAPKVRKLFAIDSNEEMLAHLEKTFSNDKKVIPILGKAENTEIENSCVDLVVCAQSFHHFTLASVIPEINRILKPNGNVFLIWYFSNMCQTLSKEIRSCFYRYGKKLKQKKRLNISPKLINSYFINSNVVFCELGNLTQTLNYSSFLGSMKSSSYAPRRNDTLFECYIQEVDELFIKYQVSGFISLEFKLHGYYIGEIGVYEKD